MTISRASSSSSAPAPRAASSAAAPEAAAASPAIASDAYAPAATPVKVITFNTAIGNPKIKTDQKDFAELPFYRKVVEGAPDAPLMALQEVGNAQRDRLKELANNGNFRAYSMKVGLRNRQNNMVLIPKRYEVVSERREYFSFFEQAKLAVKGLWGFLKSFGKQQPNWSQLFEPRGYQELRLKDTVTGKTFTMFNTHTSFQDGIREAHAKELFARAKEAGRRGPVIVAGDLNTQTSQTDTSGGHAGTRAIFDGFEDMGVPGQLPGGRTNIDWVLAKGFEAQASKMYTGDDLALPGSPNAEAVSDHYAEEDTLTFKPSAG